MRAEIQDLHAKMRAVESQSRGSTYVSTDADLTQKLLQLENEVSLKKMEVQSLKEQVSGVHLLSESLVAHWMSPQINLMRNERDSPGVNRQELNDRIMEINSLRTELDRVRKDKNITSGLVTQMQKDMANKVGSSPHPLLSFLCYRISLPSGSLCSL